MSAEPKENVIVKRALGKNAAALIQDGMVVGLGTGTTAKCFIEYLIERCHQGLKIKAVSTSDFSANLAKKGGITLLDINEVKELDIVVDGADEIDNKRRMIKGGGGALLREKIVAFSSKKRVVIVESRKLVDKLGAFPLPLEVASFGHQMTLRKLKEKGFNPKPRLTKKGEWFITDNGNFTVDIHFESTLDNPEKVEQQLRTIPGVLDTGFFFDIAQIVLIGYPDGQIKLLK